MKWWPRQTVCQWSSEWSEAPPWKYRPWVWCTQWRPSLHHSVNLQMHYHWHCGIFISIAAIAFRRSPCQIGKYWNQPPSSPTWGQTAVASKLCFGRKGSADSWIIRRPGWRAWSAGSKRTRHNHPCCCKRCPTAIHIPLTALWEYRGPALVSWRACWWAGSHEWDPGWPWFGLRCLAWQRRSLWGSTGRTSCTGRSAGLRFIARRWWCRWSNRSGSSPVAGHRHERTPVFPSKGGEAVIKRILGFRRFPEEAMRGIVVSLLSALCSEGR